MSTLLLIPPRLLGAVSRNDWREMIRGRAVLFTGTGSEEHRARTKTELGDVFEAIHFFDDLGTADRAELLAIELHETFSFTRVVATGEDDLYRAARLRTLFGIAGTSPEDVLVFRDKAQMKRRAEAAKIPVARHAVVETMTDVARFARDVGFPIVVKPVRGMGSAETRVLRDAEDLARFADKRPFGKSLGLPHMLAEKFVEGSLCHVNGLVLGGRVQVVSPSAFIGTALEYVRDQRSLGSYVMGASHPDRARLIAFATRVLEAFPTPPECMFHMECFLTPQGEIVLCEIAARLGGNGINEEVRLSYDVDMKIEWLRAQLLGVDASRVRTTPKDLGNRLAGRLLISPRAGRLEAIPTTCPEPWVLEYRTRGRPGTDYQTMTMSDEEIASFLLVGSNEDELRTRIHSLHEWFDRNTRWR
jgi:biotin carboxylase